MRVRLVNEDGSSRVIEVANPPAGILRIPVLAGSWVDPEGKEVVPAFGAIDYSFHGDCDEDGLPIYR